MPTPKNKLGKQYGWPGYVVPCDLLAAELEARKAELRIEDRHPDGDPDEGWIELIGERAALVTGSTPAAIKRRLSDVRTPGRAKIIGADTAEALLIALGALLDHDTNLPTLPGCRSAARDMAEVHAEMYDTAMTEEEVDRLARSLLNFSIGFVYSEDWLAEKEREQFELIAEGDEAQLAIPELAAA